MLDDQLVEVLVVARGDELGGFLLGVALGLGKKVLPSSGHFI